MKLLSNKGVILMHLFTFIIFFDLNSINVQNYV